MNVASRKAPYDDLRNKLPARYFEPGWTGEFQRLLHEAVGPGMTVLDLGSGRNPAVQPADRAGGITYVGLDLSSAELQRAPTGAYDETYVADARTHVIELDERFDTVLSFQVLEHVRPLDHVVANVRRYLRPGGRFVAQFSGTFSVFGVINKIVPQRIGTWSLEKLLQRHPESIFPAHYHHCYHTKIRKIFDGWTTVRIVPIYAGASYLHFSRPLQVAYLTYENWAVRSDRRNLASHYVVDAIR
jgi:SAM-dependent methyltransferase